MPKSQKFVIFKSWSNLTIPPDFPSTALSTFISAPVTQTNHRAHSLFSVLMKQCTQICSPGHTSPIPKQSPKVHCPLVTNKLLSEKSTLPVNIITRVFSTAWKPPHTCESECKASTWAGHQCRVFTATVVLTINETETCKKGLQIWSKEAGIQPGLVYLHIDHLDLIILSSVPSHKAGNSLKQLLPQAPQDFCLPPLQVEGECSQAGWCNRALWLLGCPWGGSPRAWQVILTLERQKKEPNWLSSPIPALCTDTKVQPHVNSGQLLLPALLCWASSTLMQKRKERGMGLAALSFFTSLSKAISISFNLSSAQCSLNSANPFRSVMGREKSSQFPGRAARMLPGGRRGLGSKPTAAQTGALSSGLLPAFGAAWEPFTEHKEEKNWVSSRKGFASVL